MVGADFEVGDLVWAKMRSFPYWPAQIVKPPSKTKCTPSKKAQHYVFFFGSENYAWISDENIVHHSEEMLQSTAKKKSASYKAAIDKILDESRKVPMKSRPPIKENDESQLYAESAPGPSSDKHSKKSNYESAKKQYFAKIQKTSQNQYFAKMHKKVRKKYFSDKNKNSISKETPRIESHKEPLGTVITFGGRDIESTKKKIGFIGLGKIGQGFVKKLLETNHNVTVWNRTRAKCIEFVQLGAKFANSISNVIRECDVTFSCLTDAEAVNEVVFGSDGVISALEGTKEKGYVELSSIDPKTSKDIAEAIRNKGGKYLESPLTESKGVDSYSLVAICAGDYELYENVESCFFAFVSNVYFVTGTVGDGAHLNILTNMFMNCVNASLAESLALIKKLNLDVGSFLEFLKYGPLNCQLIQNKGKQMAKDEFFLSESFKHQHKDLCLILNIADSCHQSMPLSAAANEFYKRPFHLLYGAVKDTPDVEGE